MFIQTANWWKILGRGGLKILLYVNLKPPQKAAFFYLSKNNNHE